MANWFIMVLVTSRLMYVGPFTEKECHEMKRALFADVGAICVNRRILDARGKA